jgi:uncharacterized membrane protein YbhN (UPF0104 family)
VLAVLVYAAMLFVADWRNVVDAISSIDPSALLAVLGLAVFNYLVRTVRLRYLFGVCGTHVSWRDAFYVQWSGMTMTITPGKIGEVLKAFLAHEIAGFHASRGVALVFVERLADLLAVLALASGGLSLVGAGPWALAALVAVILGATAILSTERFHALMLRVLERQKWARAYVGHAGSALGTLHVTLKPRPLLVSIGLSVLGWGAEGVGFHLALRALGFDGLTFGSAVALYAVSTVIGALAMFPGGIGLTEGSMMGVLVAVGATRDVAFSATLIIRFATLWLGVGLGWAMFASRPKLMHGFLRGAPIESEA